MLRRLRQSAWAAALLVPVLLTACGGGSDTPASGSARPVATAIALEPGAPQATGDTATDGVNWFNFRRQQIGLAPLPRNANIDIAAQRHSNYQQINNVITHEETPGKVGFTGVTLLDRLAQAGYSFPPNSTYAYGEVIASTGDASGFNAAEDLITAIYHRIVIFEPMFKEIGAGSATVPNGNTYFTANFAARNGLGVGLGDRKLVFYPYAGQHGVPRNFFSDNESPDPVPNANEVGYPISVHADITATIAVQSFSVRPSGGQPLPVRLLTQASDPHTSTSAAAIIPLSVLAPGTVYEVQFSGTVDGQAVNLAWAFATQ